MNQRFSSIKAKSQSGFTLLELIVVVFVLGIIAYFTVPQFGGGVTNAAKGSALYESANKLTQNWMLLATAAGTSTVVASSPLLASTKTAEDVLFGGVSNVATAYQNGYNLSGILPLSDLAQGGSGAYTISGYAVTMTGGGGTSTPLIVTYSAVPDQIILQLVQKYGSGVSTLAASDTTNPVVQYGTATAGLRTLTIRKASS